RLIGKLARGIVVGILIGLVSPEYLTRVIVTFKDIFGQFLEFTIAFIIIFFITSGIASFGKHAGRMIGLRSAIAYSLFFLVVGLFSCSLLHVGMYVLAIIRDNCSDERLLLLILPLFLLVF